MEDINLLFYGGRKMNENEVLIKRNIRLGIAKAKQDEIKCSLEKSFNVAYTDVKGWLRDLRQRKYEHYLTDTFRNMKRIFSEQLEKSEIYDAKYRIISNGDSDLLYLGYVENVEKAMRLLDSKIKCRYLAESAKGESFGSLN